MKKLLIGATIAGTLFAAAVFAAPVAVVALVNPPPAKSEFGPNWPNDKFVIDRPFGNGGRIVLEGTVTAVQTVNRAAKADRLPIAPPATAKAAPKPVDCWVHYCVFVSR